MQLAPIPGPHTATPVDPRPIRDARAEIAAGLAEAGRCGDRATRDAGTPVARSVLGIAVSSYWSNLAPSRPLRAPFDPIREEPVPSDHADDAPAWAERFGKAAACLRPVEAGHAFGRFYTAMLPSTLRKRLGIFYTPPPLADHVLSRATEAGADWASARILEPACGGGAILLPTLERMLGALPRGEPDTVLDHVATHLSGIDLDPTAAWLAQVLLDAALLPWTQASGRAAPRLIAVGDVLDADVSGTPDVVLGNPPYGAVASNDARRARFAHVVHGRTNLYAFFLDRAVDLVGPGGIVAMVTPTSWLGGLQFRNLRRHLASEASPLSLDFVTARADVFDGVRQETMVSTWRRGAEPGAIRLAQVDVRQDTVDVRPLGEARLPHDGSRPWPLPRRRDQMEVARALPRLTACLADWGYRVRTGPTDASRVAARLARTPGTDHVPLIWADMIVPSAKGSLDHPDGLTWPRSRRGRPAWFDPRDHPRHPTLTPAVLLQRTTAPEQPRRLVGAVLTEAFLARHGPVAVENHLDIVEPVCTHPHVDLATLAAFLGSDVADAAFRCIGGSIAVSAYELSHLPLPPAGALVPLSRLVANGAAAAEIETECRRICLGAPADARSSERPEVRRLVSAKGVGATGGPGRGVRTCVRPTAAPDAVTFRLTASRKSLRRVADDVRPSDDPLIHQKSGDVTVTHSVGGTRLP